MKQEKQKIKEVSSHIDKNGTLWEMIYDPKKGQAQFVCLDGEEIVTRKKLEENDITYIPLLDELIEKRAILLSEYPREYLKLSRLAKEIQDHIHRYLDVPESYEKIASWYIIFSWLADKIGTTSFLRALGDYATGKSRFKRVIGGLCYKPLIANGVISLAPIYRSLETHHCTLVLDEMDLHQSNEKNEYVKVLNCGNERGNTVIRCQHDDPSKLKTYDPFGPKILCTRKNFSDPALESRCITVVMKETTRTDIPPLLIEGDAFFEEEKRLRDKLLMYRLKNYSCIHLSSYKDIDLGNIEPRLKQDMMPLAMLFWKYPEMRAIFTDFVRKYNRDLVEQRAGTFEGMIVNAIFSLIAKEDFASNPYITSSDIANEMQVRYKLTEKPKPSSIGSRLRILGLKSESKRVKGVTKRVVVLDEEILMRLKRKYVLDVTDVTDVTGPRTCETIVETKVDTGSVSTVTAETTVTPTLNEKIERLKKLYEDMGPILEKEILIQVFEPEFIEKCIEKDILIPTGKGYSFSGLTVCHSYPLPDVDKAMRGMDPPKEGEEYDVSPYNKTFTQEELDAIDYYRHFEKRPHCPDENASWQPHLDEFWREKKKNPDLTMTGYWLRVNYNPS